VKLPPEQNSDEPEGVDPPVGASVSQGRESFTLCRLIMPLEGFPISD